MSRRRIARVGLAAGVLGLAIAACVPDLGGFVVGADDLGTPTDGATDASGPPPDLAGRWHVEAVPGLTGATLTGVWAASLDDVWVIGRANLVLHRTGSAWNATDGPSGLDAKYDWTAIHGRSGGSPYLLLGGTAGTTSVIVEHQAGAWTAYPKTIFDWSIRGLWTSSSVASFAVGARAGQCEVLELISPTLSPYYDEPTTPYTSATAFNAIGHVSMGNAYAGGTVGDNSTALVRFEPGGLTFSPVCVGTAVHELFGVWADGTPELERVTAVGGGDTVAQGGLVEYVQAGDGGTHCVGSNAPGAGALRAVSGANSTLIAVGDAGHVILNAGADWTVEPTGTAADLVAVWMDAGGTAYAVGNLGGDGIVLRRDP